MKKVLFATTALIATATMAAAEVKISGYGRFGLDYNDANDPNVNGVSSTTITSRLRLQFDVSTTTDGGVTLGARQRIQTESRDNNAGTAANPASNNGSAAITGARFYASYGGFTVGVGNILGALDAMPGLYLPTNSAGTGIDGMGFHSLVSIPNQIGTADAFNNTGVGNNGIEVLYKSGAFAAHVSYSSTNRAAAISNNTDVQRTGYNVSYTFGDWTVALGGQSSNVIGEDVTVLTATGKVGQFDLGIAYGNNQDFGGAGVDVDKVRIYGAMDIGTASNLLVWVANEDNPTNVVRDGTYYGVHYAYDLGGGASFEAGWVETPSNQTQVQAGVFFKF